MGQIVRQGLPFILGHSIPVETAIVRQPTELPLRSLHPFIAAGRSIFGERQQHKTPPSGRQLIYERHDLIFGRLSLWHTPSLGRL